MVMEGVCYMREWSGRLKYEVGKEWFKIEGVGDGTWGKGVGREF